MMMNTTKVVILCLIYVNILYGDVTVTYPGQGGIVKPNQKTLTSHCYHVPANDFGFDNNVLATYGTYPKIMPIVGDKAIDFTLTDINGNTVTLTNLLKEKPVVMIWGQYTCPTFQGYDPEKKYPFSSYTDEYDLVEKYHDKVFFLHMVGPEPYPMWPHASFETGGIKMNYWSTISQPLTYDERISVSVALIKGNIHPKATVLPDKLDGKNGVYNNAVWCSYAHASRAAFLIDQDGKIRAIEKFFNRETMDASIQDLFPDPDA